MYDIHTRTIFYSEFKSNEVMGIMNFDGFTSTFPKPKWVRLGMVVVKMRREKKLIVQPRAAVALDVYLFVKVILTLLQPSVAMMRQRRMSLSNMVTTAPSATGNAPPPHDSLHRRLKHPLLPQS